MRAAVTDQTPLALTRSGLAGNPDSKDGSGPGGNPEAGVGSSRVGEPLLLIHPLGGDRHVWDPVLPDLAADHDCIAVDMPGFGESPELPPDVAPTPAALARAVAGTLDALGIDRAHVAGISLGGWVALELGRTGRARSVTAICAAGFWRRPLGPRRNSTRHAARALLPVLPLLVRSRRVRSFAFSGTVVRPERVSAADAARRIRAYATAPGFDRANDEMRSSTFTGIDQIAAPVTLAWGELDRLVRPPSNPPRGVRTVTLAGCGHVPTWDDPDQVAHLIRSATAEPDDAADAAAGSG